MSEFRFNGVSPTGQSVQGTVYAKNKRTAQKKITNLAEQHSFQLRELEQRMIFRYKVRNSLIVVGGIRVFVDGYAIDSSQVRYDGSLSL